MCAAGRSGLFENERASGLTSEEKKGEEIDKLVFVCMILSRLVLTTESCKVGSVRRYDDDERRARESKKRRNQNNE